MANTTSDPVSKEPAQNVCQHCTENPAEELHACPYQWEINDDQESLCNCCDGCRQGCSDDI